MGFIDFFFQFVVHRRFRRLQNRQRLRGSFSRQYHQTATRQAKSDFGCGNGLYIYTQKTRQELTASKVNNILIIIYIKPDILDYMVFFYIEYIYTRIN